MGRIVGIDLGTTTSEIAYIKNGKPEIIKNGYSSITPSVVGLSKNMELLVGEPAKNQMLTAKDRTVLEVKRKMGTSESVVMAGKKFSPVDISALILKELKRVGEDFLHESITDAVITVPANFNDIQRKATKDAGEKAGLNVVRIINEPTAAALAYGIDNNRVEGKLLVYDLGGGTFDVTVLEMIEGSLDVLASRGINRLGGKDFDEKIEEEILSKIQKEYAIDLSRDIKARARIKGAAEEAKIRLSSVSTAEISLPFIAMKDGEAISFEMDLTRSEYEKLIAGYVKQSLGAVNEALTAAKLKESDIDIVIAVGGSSRTPLIQAVLGKRFPGKIRGGVNPDEAVALGAAVQAGLINNELSQADDIAIFDVCSHSLGVETYVETSHGKEYGRFFKLIPRDTHLPYSITRTCYPEYDYQTSINIRIYQGEESVVAYNTFIDSLQVSGIPATKKEEAGVDLTYSYNYNGILDVKARVCSTGREVGVRINMLDKITSISEAKVQNDDLEWENYTLASEIKTTMGLYQERRQLLPDEAKRNADALAQQLKKAAMDGDSKRIEELDDALTALLFEF